MQDTTTMAFSIHSTVPLGSFDRYEGGQGSFLGGIINDNK
jgi:hypothetical protein